MYGHPKSTTRHRKRLGQIFLRDPLIIEQIVMSAALAPHDIVLEVGPGRGALTGALSQRAQALYAIEIDRRYAESLGQRFAAQPHVHIVHADARQYDYARLPAPLVVVANLPYSMGLPILRRLFVFRQRLSRLIIMLQKEVAARFLAQPGTSAYSALSVYFQYYADIRHCFEVSRHAFTPVPAVDSTVLSLTPFATLPWPNAPETFFLSLVKCAFAHRRKTLRANLLSASHLSLTKVQLAEIFSTLQWPENMRPQELHVAQFAQLAAALHGLLPQGKAAGRRQFQ
jgi:16S rRNA (adenine1518-N6/adenine1519-N6)-dimethyltransferase